MFRMCSSALCVALLLLSACATDPPPQASIVATPSPPKVVSFCDGLIEGACTKMAGCQWIKHASPKDKDGRPLTDYCRLKTVAAAAKK